MIQSDGQSDVTKHYSERIPVKAFVAMVTLYHLRELKLVPDPIYSSVVVHHRKRKKNGTNDYSVLCLYIKLI